MTTTPPDHTPTPNSGTKRIAKNTLVLYVRMVFALGLSLYTSRVLLDVLGVEDYGLYNVVGGVVVMLGFFNGAMVSSTQRFFSFAIGQNDTDQLRRNYSTILVIQLGLALLVLLLAETLGLWFVRNYLVIPTDRLTAALWVYHLAILSFIISIFQVPFTALIITHEDMSAYAYISIGDLLLKFGVVLALPFVPADKLISYAILLLAVALVTLAVYVGFCRFKYQYVKFSRTRDRSLFRVLVSYMGWNLWGNSATVIMNQGVNVLLNLFFGPTVNAARAIAYQVRGGVAQLSANFQMAMNPQIVKTYAAGQIDQMHRLVLRGAKLSFFLVSILALPVIFNAEIVLDLWLKDTPQYAVLFTQLVLIDIMIESISGTMMTAIQATGKIALYQSVVGGLLILNLPLSYIALKIGYPPEVVFFISIIISTSAFFARVFIVSNRLNLRKWGLIKELFLRMGLVFFLDILMFKGILSLHLSGLQVLWANLVTMLIGMPVVFFLIAMTGQEKDSIIATVKSYVDHYKNKH